MARFLIPRRQEKFRKMTTHETISLGITVKFSCATKNSIADAQRAADATVHETSLRQTIEKHRFRVTSCRGAGLAVEREA